MEPVNTAICISGQVRSPVSLLQRIAAEATRSGADVFISVWSQVGQKTFEGAVGPKNIRRIVEPQVARQIPESWLGRMKEVFPDFNSFFPTFPPVSSKHLAKIFPEAKIEVEADSPAFDFAAVDSNSLRMLHRIWRANAMKRAAEQARGRRYDKVLRLRPDMLFDGQGLAQLMLDDNVIFVQGHAGNRADHLNDTIWATNSENDDAICALYQRCKTVDPTAWRGIHRELAEAAKAAGLIPSVIRIIKPATDHPDGEYDERTKTVGKNLLEAIAENRMEQAQAGGAAFCTLVSAVVRHGQLPVPRPCLPDDTLALLESTKQENRNAYQQALLYLSNICIQDQTLSPKDRLALLFRVLLYYSFQKAERHIEVRIAELPEVFDTDPLALQELVVYGLEALSAPQGTLPEALASRFDALWDNRIKADKKAIGEQIRHRLLSSSGFLIALHRALSGAGHHQQAFDLARAWADHMPENWKAYDLLAGSARALGDDTLALSVFDEAEANGATHARLLELKGNLLLRAKQPEAAIAAYEQALALPGGNRARINKAREAAGAKMKKSNG